MIQAIDLAVELDRLQGPLFEGVHLSVRRGDKVALVGPNGCGKSTLLLALMGDLTPCSGRVHASHSCKLARLPQDLETQPVPEPVPALLKALHRLGSPTDLAYQNPETLSPGERMRLALAGLLAEEPDILLLDEPTNHLDLQGREWLQEFLLSCREGVLAVTHDRAFADAFADRVLELDHGRLREYAGGYSDMLDQKRERQAQESEAYERQKAEVRRLRIAAEKTLQRAADMTKVPKSGVESKFSQPYFAALQSKLDRRAKAIKSRATAAASIELPKPFEGDPLHLDLSGAPIRSEIALQARGLSKAFDGRVLFEGLSFDLARGERIAVAGPNGAGKLTLLDGLLEPESFDRGTVEWGLGVRVAALPQVRTFGKACGQTVLEVLEDLDPQRARDLLARLGLRGDFVLRRMEVLSVGERTRVELVRLLLCQANVLILDEPTNHLDLPSLETLEQALSQFKGSVIFASHDRRFVGRVADELINLSLFLPSL